MRLLAGDNAELLLYMQSPHQESLGSEPVCLSHARDGCPPHGHAVGVVQQQHNSRRVQRPVSRTRSPSISTTRAFLWCLFFSQLSRVVWFCCQFGTLRTFLTKSASRYEIRTSSVLLHSIVDRERLTRALPATDLRHPQPRCHPRPHLGHSAVLGRDRRGPRGGHGVAGRDHPQALICLPTLRRSATLSLTSTGGTEPNGFLSSFYVPVPLSVLAWRERASRTTKSRPKKCTQM